MLGCSEVTSCLVVCRSHHSSDRMLRMSCRRIDERDRPLRVPSIDVIKQFKCHSQDSVLLFKHALSASLELLSSP